MLWKLELIKGKEMCCIKQKESRNLSIILRAGSWIGNFCVGRNSIEDAASVGEPKNGDGSLRALQLFIFSSCIVRLWMKSLLSLLQLQLLWHLILKTVFFSSQIEVQNSFGTCTQQEIQTWKRLKTVRGIKINCLDG